MTDQEIFNIPWWEREKLPTEKDREAIEKAKKCFWYEIDPNWAESGIGRFELRQLSAQKYHREEMSADMI